MIPGDGIFSNCCSCNIGAALHTLSAHISQWLVSITIITPCKRGSMPHLPPFLLHWEHGQFSCLEMAVASPWFKLMISGWQKCEPPSVTPIGSPCSAPFNCPRMLALSRTYHIKWPGIMQQLIWVMFVILDQKNDFYFQMCSASPWGTEKKKSVFKNLPSNLRKPFLTCLIKTNICPFFWTLLFWSAVRKLSGNWSLNIII